MCDADLVVMRSIDFYRLFCLIAVVSTFLPKAIVGQGINKFFTSFKSSNKYTFVPSGYYQIIVAIGPYDGEKQCTFRTDGSGYIKWNFWKDFHENRLIQDSWKNLASPEKVTILVENWQQKRILSEYINYADMTEAMNANKGRLCDYKLITFSDLAFAPLDLPKKYVTSAGRDRTNQNKITRSYSVSRGETLKNSNGRPIDQIRQQVKNGGQLINLKSETINNGQIVTPKRELNDEKKVATPKKRSKEEQSIATPKRGSNISPKRGSNVTTKRGSNISPKRGSNVTTNVTPKRGSNVTPKRGSNVTPIKGLIDKEKINSNKELRDGYFIAKTEISTPKHNEPKPKKPILHDRATAGGQASASPSKNREASKKNDVSSSTIKPASNQTLERSVSLPVFSRTSTANEKRINFNKNKIAKKVIVKGDGNCLFRSVAVSLYGQDDGKAHVILRKNAANMLIKFETGTEFRPSQRAEMKYMIGANLPLGEKMEKYNDSIAEYATRYASKNRAYVGTAECLALAIYLKRHFAVIDSRISWVTVYHPNATQTGYENITVEKYKHIWILEDDPIVIWHDGDRHFNSILLLEEETRKTKPKKFLGIF